MKTLGLVLLLALMTVFLSVPAMAQEPVRFGALGIGYLSGATPNIQGWAALGIPLTSDNKAISYTSMDFAVVKSDGQVTVAGFQLQYSLHPGLAYRLLPVYSGWSVYGLAAPGFVADGNDLRSSFEYGGFVHKSINTRIGLMLAFTRQQYGLTADFAPRGAITIKF